MKKKKLSIHSENILPIIKKWLYSEKDIFLRELVSNSVDAIQKLKFLQSQSKAQAQKEEFIINIDINKDKKTLTISDNGIGMTEEEIEKYIAQIAFSGAEDFVKKYQTGDQIIGHFGLGFFSSYMVSKKVEIFTKSYIENEPAVHWECDGTSDYTVNKTKKENIGTDVVLHLEDDEYLDEEKIKQILFRFCPFIPFSINVNKNAINNKSPLYLKAQSECKDEDYISFYHDLHPNEIDDPIFWIHLNIDYPFNLKGILYFPKIKKNFDVNKGQIKLFCNRVFVSDNCKDILPDYLTILKGAIDSPDIPLNVSRSFLQLDPTIKSLGSHIAKKIADRLNLLYQTDKDKFISIWEDIEVILKLGIMQDEKFYEKIKSFLIWKNTNDEWSTIEEYLERNKEKTQNKIFYTQEKNKFLDLFIEKKIEVLFLNQYLDTAVITFLERKNSCKFQRIDGDIDSSILDPSKEKDLLTPSGKSEAAELAEFVKRSLNINDLDVEAKSLSSNSLPGFILINEQDRRFRDYMQLTQNTSSFPSKKTFVVNTNNKIIIKAQKLHLKNPKLSEKILKHVFDLAKISQKELSSDEFSSFIDRSNDLLEELSDLTP